MCKSVDLSIVISDLYLYFFLRYIVFFITIIFALKREIFLVSLLLHIVDCILRRRLCDILEIENRNVIYVYYVFCFILFIYFFFLN